MDKYNELYDVAWWSRDAQAIRSAQLAHGAWLNAQLIEYLDERPEMVATSPNLSGWRAGSGSAARWWETAERRYLETVLRLVAIT